MSQVHTDRDGRVLTIRLDNPPYNMLTTPMMKDLQSVLRSLARDRTIGAVILTSAVDGVFISHYDAQEILAGGAAVGLQVSPRLVAGGLRTVGALERLPAAKRVLERTPAEGVVQILRYHDVVRRMRALDKVVIAAINGRAYGGGCELALACDIRLIADGELEDGHGIGQPEILVGLIPGGGGTQMLARSIGIARAIELILEGRPITPRQALEYGLVNRVVEPEQLMTEARTAAARLARRSPEAVAAIKRAVYKGATGPLEHGLHLERAGFLSTASTPASQRAMRAYLEDIDRYEAAGDTVITPTKLKPWLDGTATDFTTR
jgi:enoyl-CoA hydratase/carnithine racemase